jgi:hypothetical protein
MAKNHTPTASATYTTDGNVHVHLADERGCSVSMIIPAEVAEQLSRELVASADLATGLVELFGAPCA